MPGMRRALVLVLAGLLVLTAVSCGGDDGTGSRAEDDLGGDPEAFCDRLEELNDADELDMNEAAAAAAFDDLVELAPEEIDSDLARLQRAVEELERLDEDDPEAFGAAFEIFLDPVVAGSLEDFVRYAEDECGIEIQGATGGDFSDDASGGFSDDFSSDFSDDGPSDAEDLRAFFEGYADEGFDELVGGIGIGTVGEQQADVTLTLDDAVDDATAVAVCEAALAWGRGTEYEELEVEVQGPDQAPVATGGLQSPCEAA